MKAWGFLFDNDGVLVDTEELHWQAWQKLMEEEKSLKMDHTFFKKTFGKTNDLILKELNPSLSAGEVDFLKDRKEALFRSLPLEKITLLPHVESFLELLDQKGIPKIIASSTPIANLEVFLEKTALGKYFDTFVSAEEVPLGKPYPDVFLEAARRLEKDPKECFVIEDSPAGIHAGHAAGCHVISVTTTHKAEDLPFCKWCLPHLGVLDLQKLFIDAEA